MDDLREIIGSGGGGGVGILMMEIMFPPRGGGGGGRGILPAHCNTALAEDALGTSLEDRLEELQDEENSSVNSSSERSSPGYENEISEEQLP